MSLAAHEMAQVELPREQPRGESPEAMKVREEQEPESGRSSLLVCLVETSAAVHQEGQTRLCLVEVVNSAVLNEEQVSK